MKPLSAYKSSYESPSSLPRFLFADIDDTLTNGGYLLPKAYQALWDLHDRGVDLIPVTGRPAGWCDLIIRQWPVKAVIGENGAFAYYRKDDGRITTFTHPSVAGEDVHARLKEIEEAVLKQVPGSRVARDQFGRIYDLAIDFREDPPDLGMDAAVAIKKLCESFGAIAKISSIHVNTWFGEYDKLSMVRLFMKEQYGLDEAFLKKRAFFCGDSPNDEPMFAFFPNSFGVGNLKAFADIMEALPTWIANADGGLGFSEIVKLLLSKEKHSQ
jgi:1,2-diacylglycerol 3-alpha-glucosyltransferase